VNQIQPPGERLLAGNNLSDRGHVHHRLIVIGAFLVGIGFSSGASAESVSVKHRGPVDLAPFACEWIERSSPVKRLCYDAEQAYVIVNVTGTYYYHCEVPANVIADWRAAESMGRRALS
jgi:hypothetical protein